MDEKKLSPSGLENSHLDSADPAEAPSLSDETEAGAQDAAAAPKSQAVLDFEAGSAETGGAGKKTVPKSAPQNLAAVARFRWVLLFVLSLASLVFWAAEAQVSGRPYKLIALVYLALGLILTIPTVKFLRIPTRGGLAAMLWAGTFFMSALYGPSETLFNTIPASLPWGCVLIMILLWAAVAVWRKIGRYRVVDILLSLVILYAALAPVLALASGISSGNVLSMNFQSLNTSPFLLTNSLPWFLWPITALLALILPFCALISLWDQLSVLKRRGARHGGNIFLALAFLLIIPYGFVHHEKAFYALPALAAPLMGDPAAYGDPLPDVPEPLQPAPEILEEIEEPMAAAPEPERLNLEEPDSAAPASPILAPEDRITNLENKISGLEGRLETLSRELEQLKRGEHPIPPPPAEPPAESQEQPLFSSST